jgi:hypothetical protein
MMMCPVSFVYLDNWNFPEREIYFFKDHLWIHPQKPILSLSATATLFFKLTLSLQDSMASYSVNKIFSEKKVLV